MISCTRKLHTLRGQIRIYRRSGLYQRRVTRADTRPHQHLGRQVQEASSICREAKLHVYIIHLFNFTAAKFQVQYCKM